MFGGIIELAISLGIAICIFSAFTGISLDEILSKFSKSSPTKKELENRVAELESRMEKMESGH